MVNMGTVWDRTTEFLSDNLSAILPIAVLAIFVPQSISSAIGPAKSAIGPALSQILILALLLPILWGQLVVAALTLNPEAGRISAQSVATRRFGQLLLAMLVVFAVIALLASPVLIALAAGGMDITAMIGGRAAPQPAISPAIGLFVALYGVLLMGLVVFVSVRLSTLLFAVIAAEGGVTGALRRSFALTRGIFWKTFGVLLLFGVVLWVSCLAVTFVFGAVFRLIAPDAGPLGVGAIVVAILVGVLTTAYSVVVSIFTAKLYRAMAAREGSAAAT